MTEHETNIQRFEWEGKKITEDQQTITYIRSEKYQVSYIKSKNPYLRIQLLNQHSSKKGNKEFITLFDIILKNLKKNFFTVLKDS